MSDDLKQGFVPVLDGEELLRDDDGTLRHKGGAPIDPARADDVVYVRPGSTETAWWRKVDARLPRSTLDAAPSDDPGPPSDDVADLLLAIGRAHRPEDPTVDVDAGFFHRTLVRWMGVAPDDDVPAARAPTWDYGFWKAELLEGGHLEGHAAALSSDAAPAKVTTWTAVVWRGEEAAPERYRYWVAFDELGFVKGSGWLSAPPDLLGEGEPGEGFPVVDVEPALLAGLLADPE